MAIYNLFLLIVGVLFGGLFIGSYWYYHPYWYQSDVGKLLITFSANVFMFYLWYLFLATLGREISPETRTLVRTTLFTFMTASIVIRYVLFMKVERKLKEIDAAVVEERTTE